MCGEDFEADVAVYRKLCQRQSAKRRSTVDTETGRRVKRRRLISFRGNRSRRFSAYLCIYLFQFQRAQFIHLFIHLFSYIANTFKLKIKKSL